MGLFSYETPKTPSLEEQLSSIKSVFITAHDKAVELINKIASNIEAANQQKKTIEDELANLNALQEDTAKFIANTEKFL